MDGKPANIKISYLTSPRRFARKTYATPGITGDTVIVLRQRTRLESDVMGPSVQFSGRPPHRVIAIACAVALLVPAYSLMYAQQFQAVAPPAVSPESPLISADQLDSLVAPIALYPDPLLAQTLAASTYPLEVIQLQQWMANNSYLRDQALADAVEQQPWDPSVQAMATFPDVVKLLSDNIAWMTDLGNAFLAQQGDLMDAVQRMRARAQSNGNLNTTPEQTVQMQTVEGGEQAIVIEPADPGMVYVPAYDPTVVYGSSAYAYPTLYYASPAYYRAGGALAFGAGVALGAAWGGNWGYGCKWANGDININYNNKYVSNSNRNRNINYGNRPSQQPAGVTWQHNSQHRGGTPYGDRRTANKYAARSGIQAAAAGTNRSFSGLTAGNPGNIGGDRIANRNVSPNLGAANAFGSAGFNGNSVRASSNRGNNSFGGAGAGRGARGGGGGGGRRR